jgi:hypothetical protein
VNAYKRINMKKILHYYGCLLTCICITLLGFKGAVYGQEQKIGNQKEEKEQEGQVLSLCTKDVLMTFFPAPTVKSVLIRNQIPSDQAEAIAKELSKKDQDILKLVEKKASQMDPNPFKDLSQRDAAIKLFRETLYEVFTGVLKEQGIADEDKINTYLEDIREAKGKLFVECIRKEKLKEHEPR